jgi:CheY-like chemotaxis protein
LAETPKTKQALVVDDDAGTRNLFRLVLGPMGYRVVMAASGHEALDALAQQVFDLVITDLHLPDMTGLSVSLQARDANPRGHIVMATIDDDADTMSNAFLAGCNVYLIKPYNLDHVIELVRRLEQASEPVRLLSDRLGVHDFH